MPKIPRDISGQKLARILEKYAYEIKRQTGSHLRLVSLWKGSEHRTHRSISYGFFNALILKGKWQCKSCWNDAQVKETVS
jgi:hypothetical protein